MPQERPALQRTIMVVDVADFTNPARTRAHQEAVQQGMYGILRDAFVESGIPWESCEVEDRGDGAMILIPPEVPLIRFADHLPERLVAALRRFNVVHSTEAVMRLRVVLHTGQVHQNRNGVVSPAVNLAFRLLDAEQAKSALRESTEVVAFIVSNHFYDEVVAQDAAAAPGAYRRIPVAVKGLATEAWLRLTGSATEAWPERPAEPEPPTVPEWHTTEDVQALLSGPELKRLYEWLSDVTVPHLSTIVRRAAGPTAAIPATDNAWMVFLELTDLNAGSDGVPPALLFLDLLATILDDELDPELLNWINSHARRMRLDRALPERTRAASPVPATPRLHLLIIIEPAGPGAGDYSFSHWRQDDPDVWPPARGDIREVPAEQLEQCVDEVLLDAERAWAGQHATVVLEFLLPRTLLHLPVHRWRKELAGNARPLCIDYPIVLRSLERMRNGYWHRVWHDRWRTLLDDPSVKRIHFGQSSDTSEPYRIDALLSDPAWVALVLADAPPPEPRPGTDELAAALSSGLPALFWHPAAAPDGLREVVSLLAEGDGLENLPERVHASRRDAFVRSDGPSNVDIRDLVVLWDDPRRIIAFDQPTHPPQR